MGRLQQHEDSGEGLCAECKLRPSVGPCAACYGMICGDCCTLVTDPAGKRVICLSCANMAAGAQRKALQRRTPSSRVTAWSILVVLALGLAAALLRP